MWKISRAARRAWSRLDPRTKLLDPPEVRIYIVVHWWFGAIAVFYFRPPLLKGLAVIGILLGTLGAGFLYRESMLTKDDISIIVDSTRSRQAIS
jgi:protein-S-isoprenylcysteine O-methyltransferase Ste14